MSKMATDNVTVKCGQAVLMEEPYCHVLLQKHRSTYCDYCFVKGDALRKCTGCHSTWYCNAICQKSDWAIHQQECKCLKQVQPKIPMDSVRMMLRLVIAKGLDRPMNETSSRTFDNLMTHVDEIKNDSEKSTQFANIMYTLNEYAGPVVKLPSASDLLETFCRMLINAFSIFDGELKDLGTGIYLRGSIYNHSCKPNALTMFEGHKLVIRALEDIQDPSPKTVFISYLDRPFTPREDLLKQYFFECKCQRCLDDVLTSTMNGFCCPNPVCDGAVGLTDDFAFRPCTKCGFQDFQVAFKENALKVLQNCKLQLKEVDKLKSDRESKDVLDKCQSMLEDIKRVLHPMNVYRVIAVDRAMDAAIDTKQWQLALSYGLTTLLSYSFYYPQYNPNFAIQLFKIGKLNAFLEDLKGAIPYLQQAESIFMVTHGQDHEMLKEVRKLIGQCQEELRMQLMHA